MRVYQALISRPDNIERIKQARQAIERVGGKITIEPPTQGGMTVVTLRLPDSYSPDDFLPGLPFYPY
jgi:hypothetical protein